MDLKDVLRKYPKIEKLISSMPPGVKVGVETVKGKTIVAKAHEKVGRVLLLCSGSMEVFNEFESGNIIIVEELGLAEFIGEIETLAGLDKFVCTVSAISDCIVLSMSPKDFLRWFYHSDSFARELAIRISTRNCRQAKDIGSLKYYNSSYRIGAYLLQLAAPYIESGKTAELKITRIELAHRQGASERTVNRLISKLKDKGIVTSLYGKILISQQQYIKLEQWVEEVKE